MIRIVRLGSPRAANEGVRIGTVRRPPRGVPKIELGTRNFYDVWLPTLAPSELLLKEALAMDSNDTRAWRQFERRYRKEMKARDVVRLLDTFAVLSKHTNLSVGCYCAEEQRCHRAILRQLLIEHGAEVAE